MRSPATSIIWIRNLIADERTFEIGIVRRGKYTLPNSPALPVKVEAFPFRQAEKKPQIALPER